jgi:hypothetical protein
MKKVIFQMVVPVPNSPANNAIVYPERIVKAAQNVLIKNKKPIKINIIIVITVN